MLEINLGNNLTRGVNYQYGGGFQTQTAYVVVTYSAVSSSWRMELTASVNCGGDIANITVARVRDYQTVKNKTTTIDRGRYYMPFRLITTRKLL